MAEKPPSDRRIPLTYRLFFLWVEPLCAVNGAIMSEFAPLHYLKTLTPARLPQPPSYSGPTPIETMLLRQAASLILVFAVMEGVLLRAVGEQRRDLWRLVLGGMLLSDLGWLYAAHGVAGAAGGLESNRFWVWNFWMWNRKEEWGNLGMTWLPFFMRVAFLVGIGM